MSDYNSLGFYFVSERVPNNKEIENKINDKCEELIAEAKEKLDDWLDSLGLEMVMGVVVQKGSIK